MGVVQTADALVVKIIAGRDDKPAVKSLCDSRHAVGHGALIRRSLASPITHDDKIQHHHL
jgi:hypothetical protein